MKNDSRKGLGIAGAIALGVAAVTAIVAVAKKKSSKPKQKRSIYKPELIKLPLKSEGEPVRVRPEFKDQPIREEDPYEYSYDSSYEEQTVEKQSFFKDVEVSYEDEDVQKDDSQTVSITDVVSEEVYVSEDQEIIIEAVMVGKSEEEQVEERPEESVEEQPEESVEEQPEEPVEEQVEEQLEEQDDVTIEEVTVGRTEPEEIVEEATEAPVEEATEEAVEEPLAEEAEVTYEEPAVTYEEAKDAWEGTPEPVIEFYEEEPVEEIAVEEPVDTSVEIPVEEPIEAPVEEVSVEEPVVEIPVEEEPVEEPVVEIPVEEEPIEEPEAIEPQVEEQALLPHESYYDWVYNVDEHYNVKTDGTWVYCLSDEILVSTSVNKKGGHETINIADTFKNKITTRGYCLLKYIGSDREIVIPSEINGLPVVAAMNTFRSNQTIKKVTIPACMEAIRRTFYSCYHLDRIIIEKGSRIVYELDAIMCGNNDMDSGTESTTVCCTEDLIEYFKRHYKLGCPVVFEEIK